MSFLRYGLVCFLSLIVFCTVNSVSSAASGTDDGLDTVYEGLDADKDGKVSKDEWDAVDADKDGQITSDEWEKYHYKSGGKGTSKWKVIMWVDPDADDYMYREEFNSNR